MNPPPQPTLMTKTKYSQHGLTYLCITFFSSKATTVKDGMGGGRITLLIGQILLGVLCLHKRNYVISSDGLPLMKLACFPFLQCWCTYNFATLCRSCEHPGTMKGNFTQGNLPLRRTSFSICQQSCATGSQPSFTRLFIN